MLDHVERPNTSVRPRTARGRRASSGRVDVRSHVNNERPCARCGKAFQPTLIRRMTCHGCYLTNTDVDPIASAESDLRFARPTDG